MESLFISNSRCMKKVLFFIVNATLLVVIADVILGYCSINYVKTHDLPGRYQPLDKLIKHVEADVLLIGNSLIANGLNPQILEDSLGMNCYNGGITGQGIDFFETMIDCALHRYTPRIVVLGMRPEEMGENIGAGLYEVLRPYYHTGYSSIDEHFDNVEPSERILLKSSFYRFNIVWARILIYSLFDHSYYAPNGFHEAKVPRIPPVINIINKVDTPVKWKMDCLERIIQKCQARGVKICVCFPPSLLKFPCNPVPCVSYVDDLCKRYGVPCFQDYYSDAFIGAPELFSDNAHLNRNGATVYSQLMSSRLNKYFLNDKGKHSINYR